MYRFGDVTAHHDASQNVSSTLPGSLILRTSLSDRIHPPLEYIEATKLNRTTKSIHRQDKIWYPHVPPILPECLVFFFCFSEMADHVVPSFVLPVHAPGISITHTHTPFIASWAQQQQSPFERSP